MKTQRSFFHRMVKKIFVGEQLNVLQAGILELAEKIQSVEKKITEVKSDFKIFEKGGNLFGKIYYSQDGEDAVLMSFYEDAPNYRGFYVDIGAFHPLRFSNTQLFYERGWRGINVDATPGSMDLFCTMRLNDINVEAGISRDGKSLTFFHFEEEALNSFDPYVSDQYIRKGWKLRQKKIIPTMTINDLFDRFLPKNQKIDFLTIDVEGSEGDVLEVLNWGKYAPEFFLIEDLPAKDENIVDFNYRETKVARLLMKEGYILVARTRRTSIFCKKIKFNNV